MRCKACLDCCHNESAFRRIAQDPPPLRVSFRSLFVPGQDGIIAQEPDFKSQHKVGVVFRGNSPSGHDEFAVRPVSYPCYFYPAASDEEFFHSHFISRQSAGFVSADHRNTAKGFNCREPSDYGRTSAHPLHSQSQGNRDYSR